MNTIEKRSIFVLFMTIFLACIYFYGIRIEEDRHLLQLSLVEGLENPFSDISIMAQSAYVYEAKSGEMIFMKHPNRVLPIASITKLMTTFTTKKLLGDDDTITLSEGALREVGDSGFIAGEKWALDDMLKVMLLSSSNDAAYAIEEKINSALIQEVQNPIDSRTFVSLMNEYADILEIPSLKFLNPHGLDKDGVPQAFGNAEDVAKLAWKTYSAFPDIIGVTKNPYLQITSIGGFPHEFANTNTELASMPGLVASKTGYTSVAGGNLVTIFETEQDQVIVIAILGSTYLDRFSDTITLHQASDYYLNQFNERGIDLTFGN